MDNDGVFSRFGGLGGREDDVSAYGDVHVLAVDDSLVDRKVIERLLRITSCKVTAVDSGIRALQFLGLGEEERSVGFHDLKVDLIITDYCMPEMSGYELLKKIKGSSSLREIPVVIMSSENILARIDRCLEEGAEDFIVKPVKLSDVERLKTCMGRKVRDEESINSDAASIFDVSSGPSPPNSTSSECSSRTSSPSRPSSPMPVDSPTGPENDDSHSHCSDASPRT